MGKQDFILSLNSFVITQNVYEKCLILLLSTYLSDFYFQGTSIGRMDVVHQE